MRILISIAFFILSITLAARGQGTAIRSLSGVGTNVTLRGNVYIREEGAAAQTNLWITPTDGDEVSFSLSGGVFSMSWTPERITIRTNLLITQGQYIGNGGGLTNLVGATNFSSSVTYNFNGKTTFNSVSYNTNAWGGPTNAITLTTNYQFFVASTDCNINGIAGRIADQNTWTTLTVSNSTAGDITVRSTASGLRPQGSSTLAALIIGAGKEGYLTYHCRGFLSTNFVTTAQQ